MTNAPFDRSLGLTRAPGVSPGASSAAHEGHGTPHSISSNSPYISVDIGEAGGNSRGPLYNRLLPGNNRRQVMAAPMLNEVYNSRILELAGNIPRIGRLPNPDATATAHSKLCGSTVTIDLKMDGETVTDFAHDVKACALGQASSSIMARNIVGAKADELRELREDVRRMLKENGVPPANGRWTDIAVLEPVRDYKARHASTLLTFDAVISAIDQIAAKRAANGG
jgi:NifU-like protein involved in Fe-S cluster formation